MRFKVFTVPAALLVLFCVACNNARENKMDKVDMLPAQASASGDAASADSTRVAIDNEDQQTPDKPGGPAQANQGPDKSGNPRQADKGPVTAGKPGGGDATSYSDWDRKIVKTADLTIEVKNFQRYSRQLHGAVRQSGGYVAQEQQTQSSGEIENTVSIKVPVDRFQDLLEELPGDSDRLVEKKVSSEDVTMELVDTKSRLETKKEVRERYLELLRQAHSMKDIIAVQNEINDIQFQMDQASGRIAWLGHSAAYSTINLKFYQVLDAAVREDPSPSFFHRLAESVGEGWKGLSSLLLELMSVWPLWIALAFGIGWIRKTMRGVRAKTAVAGSKEETGAGQPEA